MLTWKPQIEIPLPPENRYHSVFACPVSKDQSTEQNPPMMMSCGHVVSKDSLQKLSKANGYVDGTLRSILLTDATPFSRVKCPYCPVESQVSDALRVHF
jgi:E3 ubiquitin-protein transferase RMND5